MNNLLSLACLAVSIIAIPLIGLADVKIISNPITGSALELPDGKLQLILPRLRIDAKGTLAYFDGTQFVGQTSKVICKSLGYSDTVYDWQNVQKSVVVNPGDLVMFDADERLHFRQILGSNTGEWVMSAVTCTGRL